MITVTPPQAAPYIPSNMTIATIKVYPWLDPNTSRCSLRVQLFSATGANIPVNPASIPPFNTAAAAAYVAYAGGTDPQNIAMQKAALPYLKSAYALTGTLTVS